MIIGSITLHTGHDCFYYTESQSFTHLAHLCTLGPFNTQKLEHELVAFTVRYHNLLGCKQMTTFSPSLSVSAQLVKIHFLFRLSSRQNLGEFYGKSLWNFIRVITAEICFSGRSYNRTPFGKSPSITRRNYFLPNSIVIYTVCRFTCGVIINIINVSLASEKSFGSISICQS